MVILGHVSHCQTYMGCTWSMLSYTPFFSSPIGLLSSQFASASLSCLHPLVHFCCCDRVLSPKPPLARKGLIQLLASGHTTLLRKVGEAPAGTVAETMEVRCFCRLHAASLLSQPKNTCSRLFLPHQSSQFPTEKATGKSDWAVPQQRLSLQLLKCKL